MQATATTFETVQAQAIALNFTASKVKNKVLLVSADETVSRKFESNKKAIEFLNKCAEAVVTVEEAQVEVQAEVEEEVQEVQVEALQVEEIQLPVIGDSEYFVSQPEATNIDFEGSLEGCIAKADELAKVSGNSYTVYNTDGKEFYHAKGKQKRPQLSQKRLLGSFDAGVAKSVATDSPKAPRKPRNQELFIAPKAVEEIKVIKSGSKHSILASKLLQGATVDELATAVGWKSSAVRSAFHYDMHSIKGYGVRQEGDRFFLVLPEGLNAIKIA